MRIAQITAKSINMTCSRPMCEGVKARQQFSPSDYHALFWPNLKACQVALLAGYRYIYIYAHTHPLPMIHA